MEDLARKVRRHQLVMAVDTINVDLKMLRDVPKDQGVAVIVPADSRAAVQEVLSKEQERLVKELKDA